MGEKQLKKRSEIPVECTWKLDDIFPNESQWEEECEKALKIAEEIAAMQGTLGKSAANLLSYMKKNDEVETKEETTTTIDKETKNLFLLHKKKKNDSVIKRSQ